MAPCVIDQNTKVGKDAIKALNLASIRKSIPEEAFKKSAFISAQYMIRDYICWIGSGSVIYYLCQTGIWETMPFWQQALATLVFWNVAGFFMWCVFMVGHDCGHTNFSNSELVNDIAGLICHGSVLAPYHPWQLSHRRHHMYHNHEEKDYSHPWYTPEKLAKPDEKLARMLHDNAWMRFLFPFYGWHFYLYGMPDGSHYIPFMTQRMWKESTAKEQNQCYLSLAVVLGFLVSYLYYFNNFASFAYYYLGPYVMFGWWLVTVTYLQHHDHKTQVYGDEDWTFVTAAFETVDRTYGYGIDAIHHHITDGHVAHHLFFTKIPHYNLPIATKAIREYMNDNNLGYMYQHDECWDFPIRVHKYFVQFGLKAKKAESKKSQ